SFCFTGSIEASFIVSRLASEPFEIKQYFMAPGVARNLYVAVRPVVVDACWPTSKMDFRSNEAGRTAQSRPGSQGQTGSGAVAPNFVDATPRGRRSFV